MSRSEDLGEDSLERRLTRRKTRRQYRIETICEDGEDLRFTNTSDLVSAIIGAELTGRRVDRSIRPEDGMDFGIGGRLRERRDPRVPRVQADVAGRPASKIIDELDISVTDLYKVIESKTRGVAHELLLRSPSTSFSLSLNIDGVKQFDRTYTQFADISPQSDLIDAFQAHDEDIYILHIGEISWRQSCEATIRTTETIEFNNIFVNLEEFLI